MFSGARETGCIVLPQSMGYILLFTLPNLWDTSYFSHCPIYEIHLTFYTAQSMGYILLFPLPNLWDTSYFLHCPIYGIHLTFYTAQSMGYILLFTLPNLWDTSYFSHCPTYDDKNLCIFVRYNFHSELFKLSLI